MHGVRQQCGKGVGDGARRADQRGWQILEVQTCSLLGSDSILCQRPTYSHQVCVQAIPTVAHVFFFFFFSLSSMTQESSFQLVAGGISEVQKVIQISMTCSLSHFISVITEKNLHSFYSLSCSPIHNPWIHSHMYNRLAIHPLPVYASIHSFIHSLTHIPIQPPTWQ